MGTKTCCRCQKDLALNNYHKDKSANDGIYPVCKSCRRGDKIKPSVNYNTIHKERLRSENKRYCTGCKTELDLEVFYYSKKDNNYNSKCKPCQNSYNKKHNINKVKYSMDPEYIKKYRAKYNKDNRAKHAARKRERLKNDPLYKLKESIRCRTASMLRRRKFTYKQRFKEYIGCTPLQLKQYLESKFDINMTWENHGSYWHIDHIIPLSSVNTAEEIFKLCHYTNLQPLEAIANTKKGNKIL